LNRRIQWARRGADRIPRVTTATAQTMIGRHGADIRAIEAAMYNIFQQLKSVRDV
jgi:ribosomal protein S3